MTSVLIDALGWSNSFSGLTTYCYSIIKELSNKNENFKYTVLHNVFGLEDKYYSDFINSRIELVYLDCSLLSLKKEFHYLINYKKYQKYDIFYSLSSYLPLVKPNIKTISTIHDLKYINNPSLIGRWKSLLISVLISLSLRRADKVIAISHFTKSEVEKKFKKFNDITVVYEGPSKFSKNTYEAVELSLIGKDLSHTFFLCVSEYRPHKNLINLLRAFKNMLEKVKMPDKVSLVIVGNRVSQLSKLCKKLNIQDYVKLTESVEDIDMKYLYLNAVSLVFPSIYEGFGIPLVDAMHHGTPIITSNMTATREIADGTAILIDPTSILDISNAMYMVLHDKKTRSKLSVLAKEKSQKYEWRLCSDEITKLLYQLKK